MQKSSLPNKVLGKIWRLADTDGELLLVRLSQYCHLIGQFVRIMSPNWSGVTLTVF